MASNSTNVTDVIDPVLRTEDLARSFGAVRANDGISLSIERGTCHGIIGPNGSGKTTLFNLMTGYYRPDRGRVWFDGQEITGESPDRIARRGLVRTFQLVSPFESLTVERNLLAVYRAASNPSVRIPRAKVERAEEVLALLDLEHVADHEASDISGGQQKLLELGRAVMLDPTCILLDEPTAGVNPAIQRRLLRYLRELNERGTTLVIIEHDMNVVGELTDRISVLDRGQVIAQGAFEAVTEDPRVQDAYIGRERGPSPEPEREPTTSGPQSVGVHVSTPPQTSSSEQSPVFANAPNMATESRPSSSRKSANRLVASDLVTGYGSRTVLDGVSVRSHEGVTCVFGPNGSGKSTLLKALAGVIPVWSGSIEYGDRTLTSRESHEVVKAGIAAVPQGKQLFGSMTVRENLQLGASTIDDRPLIRERLEAVWDTFPALYKAQSDEARSLSGGQQVMLGFARAMMTDAEVYLLDEPVSGLAPTAIDDVFGVIRAIVDRGSQVILVEQKVREALELADYVYLISQGDIRFDGTVSELEQEDELMSLYLGID